MLTRGASRISEPDGPIFCKIKLAGHPYPLIEVSRRLFIPTCSPPVSRSTDERTFGPHSKKKPFVFACLSVVTRPYRTKTAENPIAFRAVQGNYKVIEVSHNLFELDANYMFRLFYFAQTSNHFVRRRRCLLNSYLYRTPARVPPGSGPAS